MRVREYGELDGMFKEVGGSAGGRDEGCGVWLWVRLWVFVRKWTRCGLEAAEEVNLKPRSGLVYLFHQRTLAW